MRTQNKVILGLGSSCGDRLYYLRQAIEFLNQSDYIAIDKVAPVYISDALLPDSAPDEWQTHYLNSAVKITTTLTADDLLFAVKNIEAKIGRKPAERWAPRIIDIDILSFGSEVIEQPHLVVPHKELLNRPFALWPFLDLQPNWQHDAFNEALALWGDRYSGDAPFSTRQINQQLIGPQLMGIVNYTHDSFSDGGEFDDLYAALNHAQQLFNDGAAIIDIGAESTNPNSTAMTAEQEWQRLEPLLTAINDIWQPDDFRPLISIDTYHAETAEKCLAYNIDWINDVATQELAQMASILAGTDKRYIFMHSLDVPVKRGHTLPLNCDPVQEVVVWGQQTLNQLLRLGMQREQLIYDIGIGFGNTASQALEMLQRISQFKQVELPLLIGHSRKSFMNQFTDNAFCVRDLETALITHYLTRQPVDYLRVHNVQANNQAIKISHALTKTEKKLSQKHATVSL